MILLAIIVEQEDIQSYFILSSLVEYNWNSLVACFIFIDPACEVTHPFHSDWFPTATCFPQGFLSAKIDEPLVEVDFDGLRARLLVQKSILFVDS